MKSLFKKIFKFINHTRFRIIHRVEIIRLSDKSFKETIKDVDLSTYRSTTKEGYVSLDPSKPLPHEFEEGKLSRYSDNGRQKYANNVDVDENEQQNPEENEHEAKFVSQYANATDSVILNKTEFREILMNALNNTSNSNNVTSIESEQIISIGTDEPNTSDNKIHRLNTNEQVSEINAPHEHVPTSGDDVIYLNETIEKSSNTQNDDTQKKTNPISLDTPEVDKLLNEGDFYY